MKKLIKYVKHPMPNDEKIIKLLRRMGLRELRMSDAAIWIDIVCLYVILAVVWCDQLVCIESVCGIASRLADAPILIKDIYNRIGPYLEMHQLRLFHEN